MLLRDSEEFTFFLPESYTSMQTFVRREVEQMFVESDQIHIAALVRILPLNITVHTSTGPIENLHSVTNPPFTIDIHLSYRPGHYDLLTL